MKFGCCIQKTGDVPQVKKAGYDFYEYAGKAVAAMTEAEFEELLRVTEQAGIPCIGFNSYCGGRPAIVGNAFSPEETAAYARLVCGRGRRLGVRSVGIGAPAARRLPAGYPAELADQQCGEFLRITAEIAAEAGLTVLFEAVHDQMCDYATRTAEAAAMVERLDIPNVQMVLDFYHMQVMGETLEDGAAALPYLRHAHISTGGPDLWRGYPQEGDRAEYREIFRWLKAHGYDEGVSIEGSEFRMEEAASSLRLLRELDAEA